MKGDQADDELDRSLCCKRVHCREPTFNPSFMALGISSMPKSLSLSSKRSVLNTFRRKTVKATVYVLVISRFIIRGIY